MNVVGNYSAHVTVYEMRVAHAHIWDTLLGTLFIPCLLISTLGNTLALGHFIAGRRKTLATSLYIAITVVDQVTGVAHLPVMVTFFNNRLPGLFDLQPFCTFWTVLFAFTHKMSMFLVMLLTVTRTIKIVLPFTTVSKKGTIATLLVYAVSLNALDLTVALYGIGYYYSSDACFCYEYDSSTYYEEITKTSIIQKIANARIFLQAAFPPVLIFISFAVSIVKLYWSTLGIVRTNDAMQKRKLQASITITLFTGIFLLCNLPFFAIKFLENVTYLMNKSYPGPYFQSDFMFWYSWPLGKVFFTVLNATLNPVLYYFRMSKFRTWVWSLIYTAHEEDASAGQRTQLTSVSIHLLAARCQTTLH